LPARLLREVCLLAAWRHEFLQQRIHQRIDAAHKETGHRGYMLHGFPWAARASMPAM